jgi:hypothetical protein
MGVQDRVDPVLEADHLRDQLSTFRRDTAPGLGSLIRHPDFGQKSAGMKLCEHPRIDVVGLDLGPGHRPHLVGIGNHHARHERGQQAHDGTGGAGRLQDDLVIELQGFGEVQQAAAFEINLSGIPDDAISSTAIWAKDR